MPLLFEHFCDLLSHLESYATRQSPLPPARREELYWSNITQWFRHHQVVVDSPQVDAVVVLSALLPARRTDRVYSMQAQLLSRRLRRCLCLGQGRWQQLDEWKTPGRGDLGACVERVLREAEFAVPLAPHEVTLEEIDRTLADIARSNRFSAPSVQGSGPAGAPVDVSESLQRIYQRLQSREAKWFTRMILKEYPGLELDESMIFRCLDVRLPAMMRNQDSFESAIESLRKNNTSGPTDHDGRQSVEPKKIDPLMPKVGVKVGRPTYLKGRGVKQVVNIAAGRKMSVERKYDGEYCQIHVDLSNREHPIKIFSKSGKDSTKDRVKLHGPIMESLRIGSQDCGFAESCILEGEMVVWSDKEHRIMPFCKLRKHVSRSGSFLGTRVDSPLDPLEHLMVVFYDVLLIDDDPVLKKPYYHRRAALERLVTYLRGKAKLTTRKEIRFALWESPKQLRNMLASAFVNRWEGIVLKPWNEPYFRRSGEVSHEFASCWIKMKKDYIPGLGDAADFAVVGAGYCAKEAATKRIANLKYTHFYIGCLRNKDRVVQDDAKPQFAVIDRVNQSITSDDLVSLNRLGYLRALSTTSKEATEAFTFDFQPNLTEMSVVFKEPFVFELLGAGFEKLPNQKLFTLRFPRVQKVHWDRGWKDAVSLDELQQLAEQAQSAPEEDNLRDIEAWMDRLDRVDRGVKGAMLPWDDSQEKKECQEDESGSARKSRRHIESSARAPMIRIDTAEMTSKERRLKTGEVVEDSDSPDASDRETSKETQSTSSDISWSQSCSPEKKVGTNSTNSLCQGLKRTTESDQDDPSSVSKKAKLQEDDQTSAKETDERSGINQQLKAPPLHTVTNSARRRDTLRTKSPSASTRHRSSLVRQVALSIQDLSRNFQALSESLSFQDETESSTKTSHQTTRSSQHTSSRDIDSKAMSSSKSKSRPSPNSTESPPTPPSSLRRTASPTATAPAPTGQDPKSSAISIPNITQQRIVLTSCVLELPYSLVTHLLRPRGEGLQPIPAFWLTAPGGMIGPLLTAEDALRQSLLVLVDESHDEAMWEVMKLLIAFMPLWNPVKIAIWDWRVMKGTEIVAENAHGEKDEHSGKRSEIPNSEEDESGPERKSEETDSPMRYFIAEMVLFGDEGAIDIRWQGGKISKILSKAL